MNLKRSSKKHEFIIVIFAPDDLRLIVFFHSIYHLSPLIRKSGPSGRAGAYTLHQYHRRTDTNKLSFTHTDSLEASIDQTTTGKPGNHYIKGENMQTPRRKTRALTEPQTYVNICKNKNIIKHLILPKESQFSASPDVLACVLSDVTVLHRARWPWWWALHSDGALPANQSSHFLELRDCLLCYLERGSFEMMQPWCLEKKGWTPLRFIAIHIQAGETCGTAVPLF